MRARGGGDKSPSCAKAMRILLLKSCNSYHCKATSVIDCFIFALENENGQLWCRTLVPKSTPNCVTEPVVSIWDSVWLWELNLWCFPCDVMRLQVKWAVSRHTPQINLLSATIVTTLIVCRVDRIPAFLEEFWSKSWYISLLKKK